MQKWLRLRGPSRVVCLVVVSLLVATFLSACGDSATATPNAAGPVASTASNSSTNAAAGATTSAAGAATTAATTTAAPAGPTPSPTPELSKAGQGGKS